MMRLVLDGVTVIDVPAGWTAIIVAILGIVGTTAALRFNRLARLERENRQLWWVCKRLLHLLYINGIQPDEELVEIVNGKDT